MYRRVSTDEQKENGRSLDSQKEELTAVLNNRADARLIEDITDEGRSGTDFNRDGIQKVGRLAQRDDVTHLLVDTIDRIGRTVPETLMFITQLRNDYDVKLLCRNKELDLKVPEDRLQAIMQATMAEFSTMTRTRSAVRSAADGFLEKRVWRAWFRHHIPLGYKPMGEWIEPIDEWKPIIKKIFKVFKQKRGYEATAREINKIFKKELQEISNLEDFVDSNKYVVASPDDNEGNEDAKNSTDTKTRVKFTPQLVDDKLTGKDIKSIVTNPVYKGSPTLRIDYLQHHPENPHHEDKQLAMISADKFDEVQEVVAQINEKYSAKRSRSETEKEYVDQFSPYIIESASPLIRLQCPSCDEMLISNGRYYLEGYTQRSYMCTNSDCEFGERRWPNKSELDMMKMLEKIGDFKDVI
ncbi:recombinase family protein [Halorubrum vacuolatum]|nr:recombinase family protein [Halorubrum vacuolatum]